jgi:hypothetical protein
MHSYGINGKLMIPSTDDDAAAAVANRVTEALNRSLADIVKEDGCGALCAVVALGNKSKPMPIGKGVLNEVHEEMNRQTEMPLGVVGSGE